MATADVRMRGTRRIDSGTVHHWIATILVVMVLIQAFLGGRGFYIQPGLLAMHEQLGRVIFFVALAGAIVVVIGKRRQHVSRLVHWLALMFPVLVAVQFTLGYNSQTNAEAAAWHLPTGVLIFGVAVATWIASRGRHVSI